MTDPQAKGIARGYAGTPADEKRLRAFGIKTIYRGFKGETPGDNQKKGQFKMRSGELLAVARGLRAFGDARQDWVAAEELVHSWGAAIYDIDTGLRSDRNGVKMVTLALNPRPVDDYREMQAESVKVRVKDRMPEAKARKIWFNKRLTIAQKLELMDGWSRNAAYKAFERTTVPKEL